MRNHLYVTLAIALIAANACLAFEPGTIELGVDMSAEYVRIRDQGNAVIVVPDQIKIGAFGARNISITARLASAVVSTDYATQSATSFSLGAAFYIPAARQRSWTVLEVMGLGDFVSGPGSGSQVGVGMGLGIQSDMQFFNPRMELVFERWFEGEFLARTVVKVLVGFSFYSRQ